MPALPQAVMAGETICSRLFRVSLTVVGSMGVGPWWKLAVFSVRSCPLAGMTAIGYAGVRSWRLKNMLSLPGAVFVEPE